MSTIEILLFAILVGIIMLVMTTIMHVINKDYWELRLRLEKHKKINWRVQTLEEQFNKRKAWKSHVMYFLNMFFYSTIFSLIIYHLIKFLTS